MSGRLRAVSDSEWEVDGITSSTFSCRSFEPPVFDEDPSAIAISDDDREIPSFNGNGDTCYTTVDYPEEDRASESPLPVIVADVSPPQELEEGQMRNSGERLDVVEEKLSFLSSTVERLQNALQVSKSAVLVLVDTW